MNIPILAISSADLKAPLVMLIICVVVVLAIWDGALKRSTVFWLAELLRITDPRSAPNLKFRHKICQKNLSKFGLPVLG